MSVQNANTRGCQGCAVDCNCHLCYRDTNVSIGLIMPAMFMYTEPLNS